ncbi:hypothetical protein DK66_3111 [Brucella suis 1330]|nr:hypothetical protein DK66_3111 [Brucella suis 1330]
MTIRSHIGGKNAPDEAGRDIAALLCQLRLQVEFVGPDQRIVFRAGRRGIRIDCRQIEFWLGQAETGACGWIDTLCEGRRSNQCSCNRAPDYAVAQTLAGF